MRDLRRDSSRDGSVAHDDTAAGPVVARSFEFAASDRGSDGVLCIKNDVLQQVPIARKALVEFLNERLTCFEQLPEDFIDEMQLAFTELANNAIEHSLFAKDDSGATPDSDAPRKVKITVSIDSEGISMELYESFKFEKLHQRLINPPDPAEMLEAFTEGGRGVGVFLTRVHLPEMTICAQECSVLLRRKLLVAA